MQGHARRLLDAHPLKAADALQLGAAWTFYDGAVAGKPFVAFDGDTSGFKPRVASRSWRSNRSPPSPAHLGQQIVAWGVVRYDGLHNWWELHPLIGWHTGDVTGPANRGGDTGQD